MEFIKNENRRKVIYISCLLIYAYSFSWKKKKKAAYKVYYRLAL